MAQDFRPNASSGQLYSVTFGAQLDGSGTISADSFYRVDAIGETSGFDAGVSANNVYYATVGITLAAGDKATPITLGHPYFVQGVTYSGSRNKDDITAQRDATKTYTASKFSEVTGEISGVFDIQDTELKSVLQQFISTAEVAADGSVVETSPSSDPIRFMMTRNDVDNLTAGETGVAEWMPMILDSFSFDKPLEGGQPFSFNYTLRGDENPRHIRFTKAE